MIPYIRKLERNKFELILVFLKWFLLDFTRAKALYALLNLCVFYLILQKCSACRKSFSENFDILYAYIIFLFFFVCLFKKKLYKIQTYYRHIIYQNFQKNISYNLNIFVRSNKIHTNLNKTKSVTDKAAAAALAQW